MDNNMHIYPINDIKKHVFSAGCHCQPSLVVQEGEPTVIHNSYDLREFFNQDMQDIDRLWLYYTGRKPAWGRGGKC